MNKPSYRSIMIPLDGSDFAEQALPLAIAVAARTGATLHLVRVEEPVYSESPRGAGGEAGNYPAALAERIATEAGIATTAAMLPGRTVDLLAGYAERNGIELVVIATHGLSGWSRLWHGSITDSLIKELHLPFLTIRPIEDDGEGTLEFEEIEHILIPLDGSPAAESILGHAVALGGPDVRISLIQVVPAPVPNDPASVSFVLTVDQATLDAERANALAYLEAIARDISHLVRRVDTAVIFEPRPLDSILAYADQNGVDLIAIATYGRGGIRRGGLGSIARDILRSADVPVLVFRPPET